MASFVEIKSITEALGHITDTTEFVFFDIDNTLLMAGDRANIVSWANGFEKYIRTTYATQKNLTIQEQEVLIQYHITEYANTMQTQLVEPAALDLIKTLQQRNIHIIALTARPHDTAAATTIQLLQSGIQLANHVFAPNQFTLNTLAHPIIFQDGILSCGRNSKGTTAQHFFNMVNFKPKSMVFIDDCAQYMDEMAQYSRLANIEFTGLRYGHLDEQVKQFVFSPEHVPPHLR